MGGHGNMENGWLPLVLEGGQKVLGASKLFIWTGLHSYKVHGACCQTQLEIPQLSDPLGFGWVLGASFSCSSLSICEKKLKNSSSWTNYNFHSL